MFGRTWFLIVMLAVGLAAVSWAVYGSRLPPADFTFINETEVATVDPALITGQPEGRIALAVFEGLTRLRASDNAAEPGVAERWEISKDGRTYTFHLRDNARWSNGDPVTARDCLYSIRRLIAPETASRYSYQAWYIAGAKRYTLGASALAPGDKVEVELNPPAGSPNTVRGRLLFGTLVRMEPEVASKSAGKVSAKRVFAVKIGDSGRRFQVADEGESVPLGIDRCRQVLLDFREVGVRAIDDRTVEIRLENPTPYFLQLLAFYPFAFVHKSCLEQHGSPAWTRPENIVGNGAFRLVNRRLRDRIRLERNEHYWDNENVRSNVVDALSVDNRTTALNLYMTGMVDWVPVPPAEVLREVLKRSPPPNDVNPSPQLTTYFYLLNTTRPPLDDKRVRQALSMAVDREEITRVATGAGEHPAYSLVPPVMPNYQEQRCKPHNPDAARQLLAEAGYRDGRGFPKIEILYNTDQAHQAIAELLRKQWQRELGITASLRNEEWGSFQDAQQQMNFTVSRRAWVADYIDPNTYLDMYVTDGDNNNTGFSNAEYDKLIADAAREPDKTKRIEILESAERLLMEEMPIIPIYYYVSRNMVRPRVRGLYNTLQDMHPLHAIWIDPKIDENDPRPNEYMEPVQ
ncbi:MAG TPA: peptide ABC transporter substrate-binding protein [Lacipirellulaceae bacterium]|jgi:oligopeptide transport system substrate-binding protein|nr:peptide ABC transporter substrate-binding protein [Lacipirellulaceae bacterium]